MAVYGFRNNKMIVDELEISGGLSGDLAVSGALDVTGAVTFTEGDFTSTTGPIASTADSVARLKVWANGTAYYVPLHQ